MTSSTPGEGDLSANELTFIERLYATPEITPCPVCGAPRRLVHFGPGEPSIWACSKAKPTPSVGHYEVSRFVQRRHGDADVLRLVAEVRRRRAAEAPVPEPVPPDQLPLFDLGMD